MAIKMLSLFSGLGAFEKALRRLKIKHKISNYCEIDPVIAKAYALLNNVNESLNLGDVKDVDPYRLEDFDLMTYGFPCTDLTVAKKDAEGLKGEQSGLLYEALRIAEVKKPKYMIAENVDNLATKYESGFKDMLNRLDVMGYNNYWGILESLDFGIPQTRKRVFVVSIRKDIDDYSFTLPTGDQPYKPWYEFIDPYATRALTNRQQKMIDHSKGLLEEDVKIKIEGNVQFDQAVIALRTSGLRFQAHDYVPTIVRHYGTGGGNFPIYAYKGHIGGATPRHMFKLMGFDYEDHDLLESAGIPTSTRYIMAGNSIVVNVLEAIFANLFKGVK